MSEIPYLVQASFFKHVNNILQNEAKAKQKTSPALLFTQEIFKLLALPLFSSCPTPSYHSSLAHEVPCQTSPVSSNPLAHRTAQTTAAAFQEAPPRHGGDKSYEIMRACFHRGWERTERLQTLRYPVNTRRHTLLQTRILTVRYWVDLFMYSCCNDARLNP